MQHSPEVIAAAQRTIDAAFLTRSKQDFWAFLNCLVIPAQDKGIALFRDVIADFQQERFAQIVPSLNQLVRKRKPPCQRFWWEATKGSAKDADLAIVVIWCLIAAKHPLEIQIGAADRDQAGIVKKRIENLLVHNPWLSQDVEIYLNKIVCKRTHSQASIETADPKSTHGSTPDLLILNEAHVTKQEFAEALVQNANKVSNGVAIVATNAGVIGSWLWGWRQNFEKLPHIWTMNFYRQVSPWTSPEMLESARAGLTDKSFRRYWGGIWSSGEGDLLDYEDICWMMEQHPGQLLDYEAAWDPYIAALDFGLVHDHAALVIIGMSATKNKFRIARCRSWKPRDFEDGQISPAAVQEEVWELCKRFQVIGCAYDPYQFVASAEWLGSQIGPNGYVLPMYKYIQNAENLSKMATTLLSCLRQRKIEGYPDDDLRTDMFKLGIKETMRGFKLVAASDEITGHADRAMALAIGLPWAEKTLEAERAGLGFPGGDGGPTF